MNAFEYDVGKSRANFKKHGIDFHTAQVLWDDPSGLEMRTKYQTEPRFIYIGRIGNKHWSAVFTYRGENIRLISVRRSREKEIKLYAS
jgi:uncharacterized DUF497 family protein